MKRSNHGMSLVEIIVSTSLIGICFAAVGQLVVLNTSASSRFSNKIDGQVGCSRAIRRIGEDVRQGRAIGNIYSVNNKNLYPDYDPLNNDPSTVAPISGSPPGFPQTPWPNTPYKLGPQTLIVQQPVFFNDPNNPSNPLNGIPLRLGVGSISASPPVPDVAMEYVDTIVYQLVPDPAIANQFVLQVARFSGFPKINGCKLREPINPPQIVLTGIVGPIEISNPGIPAVFQYLTTTADSTTVSSPTSAQTALVTGVSVNLEVRVNSNTNGVKDEITTAHLETYLKNGRLMRISND